MFYVQVNGINIMHVSARDVYAFGLQLIDIMFTKEEQSSLLFASKKSKTRVRLHRERVDRLLGQVPFGLNVTMCNNNVICYNQGYMDQRYGNEWDMKTFTQKANQKCRDAKTGKDVVE